MNEMIDARVRDTAIEWLVRLQSGVMSAAEHDALQRWRQADQMHEHAWQRVANLPLRLQPGVELLQDATARQALQRSGPDPRHRRQLLKHLLVLGLIGGAAWRGASSTTVQATFANYRTSTGECRHWTLADNSSLWLNTASAVNLDFTPQKRHLQLVEGELLMDTAAAAQPLHLTTPDARIITDTAKVEVRHDGSDSWVTVLKGQAQVYALHGADALLLETGWQTRVGRDGLLAKQRTDTLLAQAWLRGVLPAERMRLGDLLSELSRYRPGILRCHEQVADLRLTGSFSLDDTDTALTLITRSLPVRIERITRYWVTVVPA